MPYFDYEGETHVSVNEFLLATSIREKEELLDKLINDGYLSVKTVTDSLYNTKRVCAAESEFEDALNLLHNKWSVLTKEEEETIIKIAKRF
jgi:hypothetical protein